MRRQRLVIVGGGVSGLAAAHTAVRQQGHPDSGPEVIVLERASEVGGRSVSWARDGWLIEGGPSGYLDTEPTVTRLVEQAGLETEQLRARPAASRRFIYQRQRLHEIGPNLLKPVRSGLLGVAGVLRVFAEPAIRRRLDAGEESVWEFCRRRLGRQVADRIVRPAMLGIFAGDAERLSVDACFPALRRLEQEHGSILRGVMARRRAKADANDPPRSRKLTSFRRGLQQLPRSLARDPQIDVRTGLQVTGIRAVPETTAGAPEQGRRYVLDLEGAGHLSADAIVIASPVQVSARLLHSLAPEAATLLAQVPVPPVVVVALGFSPTAARAFPQGFGMLVSRGEGVRMLGCLWESRIYPERSPDDHLLARAMFGGRLDPTALELEDTELVALARRELRSTLGIGEAPVLSRVVRWNHAIPQYEIGHVQIRQRVEHLLEALPGVYLAGDALEGVSFAKAAASGIRQGKRAVGYLRSVQRQREE